MDYIEATKNDLKVEKELIELYGGLLESLPEGRLVAKVVYGNLYYYHILPGTQKQVYISIHDSDLIQGLKMRKHIETALKIMKENVKQQEKLIKKYAPYSDTYILSRIGKCYQPDMPDANNAPAYRNHYDQTVGYSQHHQYSTGSRRSSLDFKEDELIHKTSSGLMVRSKSEAIISEFLNKNGIRFAYEEPLYLRDADGRTTVRYPDFTIYLADGKIIYWEHLGMLMNEDYREAVWKKLALYYSNDIVPGSNLIITCDSSTGGIDIAAILRIVESLK